MHAYDSAMTEMHNKKREIQWEDFEILKVTDNVPLSLVCLFARTRKNVCNEKREKQKGRFKIHNLIQKHYTWPNILF